MVARRGPTISLDPVGCIVTFVWSADPLLKRWVERDAATYQVRMPCPPLARTAESNCPSSQDLGNQSEFEPLERRPKRPAIGDAAVCGSRYRSADLSSDTVTMVSNGL